MRVKKSSFLAPALILTLTLTLILFLYFSIHELSLNKVTMSFFDTMLLKKPLDQLGVDKNALFSDPQAYLSNNPLKFQPVKPWLMMLLLVIICPAAVLLTTLIFPFAWEIPVLCAIGFALLIAIPGLLVNNREEMTIDTNGVTVTMKGKTVHAPWTVFNINGVSDLSGGVEIKLPVEMKYVNDVVMTDTYGSETRGLAIKAYHFRWLPNQEMVGMRNFYPMGAADMAEMIRRVALTLGHQAPPPMPQDASPEQPSA